MIFAACANARNNPLLGRGHIANAGHKRSSDRLHYVIGLSTTELSTQNQ